MEAASTSATSRTTRPAVQIVAMIVSIAFLAVGIAGFVPGLTTDYSQMQFASHDSGAMLLGLFQVSVLHNIVHLLFGIVGLAMSRTPGGARHYLIGGGIVYLVIWAYGLFVDQESTANIVPVNHADNWLHLGLGAAMFVLGIVLPRTNHRQPVAHDATTDSESHRPAR